VNVIVKGSTIGTVTDINGYYRINIPDHKETTLTFSFIGLATEEVLVGSKSVIDMVMTADIRQLSEVVVTAVGIESDKKTLGYSIQTVQDEEIRSTLEPNIVNTINQKAAGVYVYSSSGSPGASASIRIRGNTSITLENNPLFVVDGVPINNNEVLNGYGGVDQSNRAIDLNPNDVASLTVLKGPAATVLYGIRAANGAIIITTKKGNKGKPKITFSTSYIASQVNKLPGKQSSYAQGRPRNGIPTWLGPERFEGFSFGPKISDLEFAIDPDHPESPPPYAFDPAGNYLFDDHGFLVSKGTGNGQPAIAYPNDENFFVTGHSSDNFLSISGGEEDINYYVSTGYIYQSGIVPKSDWSRISVLGKFSAQLTDDLNIGTQVNYINSGGSRIQRGSNISGVPLGLFRNTTTFDAARGYSDGREAANDPSVYIFPDGTQRSFRWGVYDNPFWTVNKNPYEDNINRVIGNLNFSWQIAPWVTLSYKIGLDTNNEERKQASDINSAGSVEGTISQHNFNINLLNSDILFLFKYEVSQNFKLNATLGYNYFYDQRNYRGSYGSSLGTAGFYHISNATDIWAYEIIEEKKIHGVFADILFSWDNYLFLNVALRNDWSSALPKEYNSFFYPAVSLGWTFTENLGLSGNSVFSYGKLRISWGKVGNDAPIYAASNRFEQARIQGSFINGIPFPAFGVNAFERSNVLGNPNLKAELTSTLEFGGEFQFFQERLSLDITYYTSETVGQVMDVDLAPSTGFNSVIKNSGKIGNKGWEIMLEAIPLKIRDFQWGININFTKYESFVKELDPSIGIGGITLSGFPSITTSKAIAGQPYGVLFGNIYRRVEEGKYKNDLIIGDNGWPLTDSNSGIVGDPNPDWLLGLRNTFTWKGITLSGLLDIRQGGDMWNGTVGIMNYWGIGIETEQEREVKGYAFDGVVNIGTEENPVWEQNQTPVDFADPQYGLSSYKWVRYGFGFSENEIEDASWIRLREISLSYEFPISVLNKMKIEGLSISFIGRNLFLHTAYTGIDPEANLSGVTNGFGLEYFGMPNTKSYSMNVRLTF
jgi:TonB-linked SusC/RagA family outer membrane protein